MKRAISFFLSLCMVFTLLPATVFAVGTEAEPPEPAPAPEVSIPAETEPREQIADPDSVPLPKPVRIYKTTEISAGGADGTLTRAQWLQYLTRQFQMTVAEDNFPDNYFSDLESTSDYYCSCAAK